MKFESDDMGNYLFFINSNYTKNINYDSKEDISKCIKDIILLYKKIYNIELTGFYNVSVYLNKKIGIFIEINKDKKYDFYKNDIELKITVFFDKCFYFKTSLYEVISNYEWNFSNNNYYVKVDNISSDKIVFLSDYGEFIYDDLGI